MPINGKPSYYEFFGLENFESNPKKLKAAYRSMALKWHPDRCEDKVNAERMFKQVNEINVVLTKEKDRYDNYLRRKLQVTEETVWSQTTQTSSDAWSTGAGWTFDTRTMEEALERVHREDAKRNFTGKRKKIQNITSKLEVLTSDHLDELDRFIDFLLRD